MRWYQARPIAVTIISGSSTKSDPTNVAAFMTASRVGEARAWRNGFANESRAASSWPRIATASVPKTVSPTSRPTNPRMTTAVA